MKKRGSRRGEKPRTRAPQRLSHSPHKDVRRRPTLPHPPECSTIGAVELSYRVRNGTGRFLDAMTTVTLRDNQPDRKSTRLNSSHVAISYAVFCLKKRMN